MKFVEFLNESKSLHTIKFNNIEATYSFVKKQKWAAFNNKGDIRFFENPNAMIDFLQINHTDIKSIEYDSVLFKNGCGFETIGGTLVNLKIDNKNIKIKDGDTLESSINK